MNTVRASRDEGGVDAAWMDRLVELHVLAEHGDAQALTEARHWMRQDPRARRVWETVTSVCGDLCMTPAPERE